MTPYLGELAALGTATLWAFSSIAFTLRRPSRGVGDREPHSPGAGRAFHRRGALAAARPAVSRGTPGCSAFCGSALSGLIGLVIGDSMLFQCYVLIGARIGVLLMSLSPIFGTLLAWMFLHETLTLPEIGAMALALAGVIWVVLERGKARRAGCGGRPRLRPRL